MIHNQISKEMKGYVTTTGFPIEIISFGNPPLIVYHINVLYNSE